jgi:hypothetical protein
MGCRLLSLHERQGGASQHSTVLRSNVQGLSDMQAQSSQRIRCVHTLSLKTPPVLPSAPASL